jgi:hypothetical protein
LGKLVPKGNAGIQVFGRFSGWNTKDVASLRQKGPYQRKAMPVCMGVANQEDSSFGTPIRLFPDPGTEVFGKKDGRRQGVFNRIHKQDFRVRNSAYS